MTEKAVAYIAERRRTLSNEFERLKRDNFADTDSIAQLQAAIASRAERLHQIVGAFDQLASLEQAHLWESVG